MKTTLNQIYKILFNYYGNQKWWPGDTTLEIIIGAILAQNTNWKNVEKAISNLKKNNILTVDGISNLSKDNLAELIRPAGFFNLKAKRLKNFLEFLLTDYHGNLNKMAREPVYRLREKLLNINGIGPETADSILLYAFNKEIFVIDAYTKRVFLRHHLIDETFDYQKTQQFVMKNIISNSVVFNEYHALIVRLAKDFCRVKPKCESCPLKTLLITTC